MAVCRLILGLWIPNSCWSHNLQTRTLSPRLEIRQLLRHFRNVWQNSSQRLSTTYAPLSAGIHLGLARQMLQPIVALCNLEPSDQWWRSLKKKKSPLTSQKAHQAGAYLRFRWRSLGPLKCQPAVNSNPFVWCGSDDRGLGTWFVPLPDAHLRRDPVHPSPHLPTCVWNPRYSFLWKNT